MSIPVQAIFGLLMMGVGGLKTWLHLGTLPPVLSLQTCTGKTLNIGLAQANGFEQIHCWGCYLFLLGLALTAFAFFQIMKERRSVACHMD
ncbi:MAG: hypothetical protein ACE37M_15095 [Henriciella sp.]